VLEVEVVVLEVELLVVLRVFKQLCQRLIIDD
jgi:hypothetical protein